MMVITKDQRANVTYVLFGFSVLMSVFFIFANSRWPNESFLAYSYAVTFLFLGTALLSQLRYRKLIILKWLSVCVLVIPGLVMLI